MKWINTETKLPSFGQPVLIKSGGVVQHVTYTLDANEDDSAAWFEPYFFEHDDHLKLTVKKVDAWMPVDTLNHSNGE